MRTKADLLRFAIALALRGARKLVRGLRRELSEEERYRVADDVVHRLQERRSLATVRRFAATRQGTFDTHLMIFCEPSATLGEPTRRAGQETAARPVWLPFCYRTAQYDEG